MSSQPRARSAWAKGPPVRAPGGPSPQAQSSSPSIATSGSALHASNVPTASILSPASPTPHLSEPGPQGPDGDGLYLLNAAPLNRFTPKRVTIRSESGRELDLEKWRKQVAPPAHPPIATSLSPPRAVQVRLETKEGTRAGTGIASEAAVAGKTEVSKAKTKKMVKKAKKKAERTRHEAEERAQAREGHPICREGDEAELWKEMGRDLGSAKEETQQSRTSPEAEEKARGRTSEYGCGEEVEVELPRAEAEGRDPTVDEAVSEVQDTVSELNAPLWSAFTSAKTKRRPARLDLSQKARDLTDLEVAPSALANALPIEDIGLIQYPDGVERPKVNLNVNAALGKFRYDRDFLLQFRSVCKVKPDALPPLDQVGIIPRVVQMTTGRGQHGSRSSTLAPSYQPPVGFSGLTVFSKSRTNPFNTTVGSGTTLPSRALPKTGDISIFGKIAKSAPMTLGPSTVFQKKDKLKSPESTTADQDSITVVVGNLKIAPALTESESSPVQGHQRSEPVGPPARAGTADVHPQRTGTQRQLELMPCKLEHRPHKTGFEIKDDGIFERAFSETGLAQEELQSLPHPTPPRMSEEEAFGLMDRTAATLSGLHDIATALAVFRDLPTRYHGRLVDRLVSHAIESNTDTYTQVISYFLHCAAARRLCSATAFEDGVSMSASALGDIAEETPDAVSRFATVIKGTGLHEDQRWCARVLEKVGIHGSELELKLLST